METKKRVLKQKARILIYFKIGKNESGPNHVLLNKHISMASKTIYKEEKEGTVETKLRMKEVRGGFKQLKWYAT